MLEIVCAHISFINICVRSNTNRNLAMSVENKSEFSYKRHFSKQDHYLKEFDVQCNMHRGLYFDY